MSQITRSIAGSGSAPLETLTGDVGGIISPDANGNINLFGGDNITVTGNPATFTLTFAIDDNVADTYTTDSGNAVPASHVLNVLGGTLLNTAGSANTVTINLNDGLDGQVPIAATGGSTAYATLSSADGTVVITNGANSIDLSAPATGGFNFTTVNSSPYVVQPNDFYLSVDVSSIPITIELPDAPTQFKQFIIKDVEGNASSNNITVTTVGGAVLIDGSTSFVMNNNFQSIRLLFDGVGYQIF